MSEYKKALYEWAENYLPAQGVTIIDVVFEFDKGYGGGCDTCGYGADEDKMSVWVSYTTSDGQNKTASASPEMYTFESSMGSVLRALFKIAEEDEGNIP